MVNHDISGVVKACNDALAAGVPAYRAVEALSKGMQIIGERYESGDCFLADLIMAGETMKEAMGILGAHLRTEDVGSVGKVVIGTVRGDTHDIGKNIVATLLKTTGFEVVDLGVDVSPQSFVDAVKTITPTIVGMSSLLTTSLPEMQNVIKELESAGLRSKIKVIIGGASVSQEYGKDIGADAAAKDAVQGVRLCKAWSTSN
jgi:methylmalonyl-CoA mutase cobalamin-binding domain/chain